MASVASFRRLLLLPRHTPVCHPPSRCHLREASRSLNTISINPLKWFSRSKPVKQKEEVSEVSSEVQLLPEASEKRLEKFIPVTRRTLLSSLSQETKLFSVTERRLMEQFAAALDAYYSHKFYGTLDETKLLYDNLDPDKDTFRTGEPTKKELFDQEYWLLQKVEKLLEKANYFQIPHHQLVELLHDRDSEGVIISVDHSEYETLQIWTRGLEEKKRSRLEHLKSLMNMYITRRSTSSLIRPSPLYNVYTRVFVAVRSRLSKKLHLKVLKEIPCNRLQHLLPGGKIKMSNFDKRFLASSVVLGGSLLALRSAPFLTDWKVQWTYMGLGLAGFIGARAWIGYKNKRNQYLANLATTLYFRTVANNRGVLTLLADRAQDEEFKEALLAYMFLLSPRNRRGVSGTKHTAEPPTLDTPDSLRLRIEEWLAERFDLQGIGFDIDDALVKLDSLGLLLRESNGRLSVRDLEDALTFLPQPRYGWQTLGAQRDSESSDEQMSSKETETAQYGWK